MSNMTFLRLKAGSDRLNVMQKEIQWCLSTLQGLVRRVYRVGVPLGSGGNFILKDLDTQSEIFSEQLKVYINFDPRKDGNVKISIRGEIHGMGRTLDFEQPQDLRMIEFLHKNLDVVMEAAQEFCGLTGSAELFVALLDRLLLPVSSEGAVSSQK